MFLLQAQPLVCLGFVNLWNFHIFIFIQHTGHFRAYLSQPVPT